MEIKLLTSVLLCSLLSANAFVNQKNNEVDQKPDFNDAFSSLFGLKTTFLGATRNHVNKKLDRVSGGFGGIGNLFGSLGSSSSGEGDSYASGNAAAGHESGYHYEKPATVYGAPVDAGYHYEKPAPIYGPPSNSYLPAAPAPVYGPPSNSYLPAAPAPVYGAPSQHFDGGFHNERPPAISSGSGFASNSHGSSSNGFGIGGLKDLTSIGGFGGHSKGKGSKGQNNGLGGLGNIFSSIG